MNRRIWSLLCIVSLAVVMVGCGVKMMGTTPTKGVHGMLKGGHAGHGAFTHVIIGDTDYYMNSPQQGSPSEGTLVKGTKVTLVQRAGSFSLVRSENGVQAYVSTGSIRAAK